MPEQTALADYVRRDTAIPDCPACGKSHATPSEAMASCAPGPTDK